MFFKITRLFVLIITLWMPAGCHHQSGTKDKDASNLSSHYLKWKLLPGKVTDYDGNQYGAILIGDQVWMSANLQVTHYRDGSRVAYITDDKRWCESKSGAFCNYNNQSANGSLYGRLYNWAAVNNVKGLAPKGWHIPSEQEWEKLILALGGKSQAGQILKISDKQFWPPINSPVIKQHILYNALPAGDRNNDGMYDNLHFSTTWWSSTGENQADFATTYTITAINTVINKDVDARICGFSVRCIRD